jgi:hypothetical protein
MLVIRSEQIEALEEQMMKGFEDRMVSYLARHFPDSWAALGEAAVRESIQKGIERSGSYDITTEYDVARYIELMHLFSEDFDTSPETPWAASVLEDPDLGPFVKMDELWKMAEREAPNVFLTSLEMR